MAKLAADNRKFAELCEDAGMDKGAREFRRMAEKHDRLASGNERFTDNCYITTAVCEFQGKADDCYELTQFRQFRDQWLSRQAGGEELIAYYYRTAPKLVAQIDRQANRSQIYQELYQWYLRPCLAHIEAGELAQCQRLYQSMVHSLEGAWGTP